MKSLYHNLDSEENHPDKAMPRGHKTIRIPCDEPTYQKMLNDPQFFRQEIDRLAKPYPELFPEALKNGYHLHGYTETSQKLGVKMGRILTLEDRQAYTIAPCYIMPYMTAFVADVEKALFLRKFDVPYWGLAFVFGKDRMYWYRLETSFGRNSIVGTTVKSPEKLPQHLSADEKHTKLKGQKVYIATTVGLGCVLGVNVRDGADEANLTQGYKTFEEESKNVDPDYSPETVNTDGWIATGLAWMTLFPAICIIICFLHGFIKIRDRCKNKFKDIFQEVCDKIWNCYRAENKRSFRQRMRRLKEWAYEHAEGILLEKLLALCKRSIAYAKAYDHPGCHRTSNMADRLMRWMDRHLFSTQYFHGNIESANQSIRAWAILRNFQPYCYSVQNGREEVVCAAKILNEFMYRDNWLENLLVSTSMAGYRRP